MIKQKNRREPNFIVQGSILAVASVISRLIGIVYRIPVTRVIGNEGNGYYTAAVEIYGILLLLSCYSLPLAVSKLISTNIGKGQYRNAHRIYRCAFYAALVVGSVIGMITYVGAGFFSDKVMAQPMSMFALKVLAPAILIVAIMGVLRGYFQGMGTMMPTAISQIVEQIFNAIISVAGAVLLFSYGKKVGAVLFNSSYAPAYGAAGSTLGTLSGGIAGLCFLTFVAFTYKKTNRKKVRRDRTGYKDSYRTILWMLLVTVMPVILSTALYNISSVLDQGIFNHISLGQGYDTKETAALYGIFSQKYKTLTNVPIAITSSLASSIVPTLSYALAQDDTDAVNRKIAATIRFSMIIIIPCAVGLTVLASPILQLLYADSSVLSARLLQVGSISVILYGLSTLTNAILQGINQMRTPLRNAGISLVIHLVALVLMLIVFRLHIYGVVYANIIFALSMCLLNSYSIYKYIHYRQEIKFTFVLPMIAALIMGGASLGVYLVCITLLNNVFSTMISVLLGAALYFILLLVGRAVSREDILRIPKGKSLVGLFEKLHLLKP